MTKFKVHSMLGRLKGVLQLGHEDIYFAKPNGQTVHRHNFYIDKKEIPELIEALIEFDLKSTPKRKKKKVAVKL